MASTGSPPANWEIYSDPAPGWLTVATAVNNVDGRVSGVPGETGVFAFTVTGTDSWYPPFSAERNWTVTVATCPATQAKPLPGTTPQQTTRGTAFPHPLGVLLLRSDGLPAPGMAVYFTAPEVGASGTFKDAQDNEAYKVVVVTDTSGIANAPTLTANNVAGKFTVNAALVGVDLNVPFNLATT